jgi:hypothetical protein
MATTDAILKQIESLGYAVSVHRIPSSLLGTVGAFVELHAVKVPEGTPVYMTRHADGAGDDEAYAATCELTSMSARKAAREEV